MSWMWINGRLAWPPVALVVFTTALVLAFDFSWRLITAPFWMFAAAAIAAWLIGVALITWRSRQRRHNNSRGCNLRQRVAGIADLKITDD